MTRSCKFTSQISQSFSLSLLCNTQNEFLNGTASGKRIMTVWFLLRLNDVALDIRSVWIQKAERERHYFALTWMQVHRQILRWAFLAGINRTSLLSNVHPIYSALATWETFSVKINVTETMSASLNVRD